MIKDFKSKKLITIISGGTGGHIYPSIEVLNKLKKEYNICYITDNRGYNLYFKKYIKNEFKEISIHRYNITSPFKKGFLNKLKFFFILIVSIIKISNLLYRNKPIFQIGFGGYPTVLPCLIGKFFFKINFYIHEQNVIMGRANRFLERFSSKTFISFERTFPLRFLEKRVYCGTPIRKIFNTKNIKKIRNNKFKILIIGGSLGSHFFSSSLVNCFLKIGKNYTDKLYLFHQVTDDYVDEVKKKYKSKNILSEVENYFLNINYYYKQADLIICRSGGSTLAEIIQLKIPSIIIPLPNSLDMLKTLNNSCDLNVKIIGRNMITEFINKITKHIINPNSSAITANIKSVCASGRLFFKEPSPIPFPKNPPS